ncbi:hypothetical protein C7M84_000969 [Penaeus vannamei]|uniref:Uncharacterized protein n=1 Tax=Penaeus vannamei TaxID=6689 RepID=A0A3R7MFG1_PENVA|nr:hypothetical protein C7M84_000969 [Penaeus vannamei]
MNLSLILYSDLLITFAVFLFGAHVAKGRCTCCSASATAPTRPSCSTSWARGSAGSRRALTWWRTTWPTAGPARAAWVRATRGAGPEADIALDHVSVLRGACHRDPVLDTNVTLHAALAHPHALAFSAGPALTPAPKRHLPQAQESDQPAREDQGACEGLATCTECVSDAATTCSWCDMTQTCLSSTTREAKACLDHLTVHHNTSSQTRRGKVGVLS